MPSSRTALLVVPALVLATIGYGGVYMASERYLADARADPPFDLTIPNDVASIERGRHLARTRGCLGCHGQELEGNDFSEAWPELGVPVAPNLARYAREHPPAVIEAAIRQGIGADGRALWSMPSYNFAHLSDADTADLIAFLQATPVVDKALPTPRLAWSERWRIVRGSSKHMADWADGVPPLRLDDGDDAQLARGEYLAMTTCNECHGLDLRGMPEFGTPDLAILSAYSDAQFRDLMARGEGIGSRDLGLMTEVAQSRFAYFTEQELTDLLAYLRTLPSQPIDLDAPWRQLR